MGTHMKTTIEISDPLLAAAKAEARRRGTTLRTLVEEGLAAVLAPPRRRGAKAFALGDASVTGNGLQPEFRDAGWDAIRDAAYDPTGPERRGGS